LGGQAERDPWGPRPGRKKNKKKNNNLGGQDHNSSTFYLTLTLALSHTHTPLAEHFPLSGGL